MTSSLAYGSHLTSVVQSIHHHIELLIILHIILWAVKIIKIVSEVMVIMINCWPKKLIPVYRFSQA